MNTSSQSALLAVDDLHVTYDGIISALRGVSLSVAEGDIAALLGSNGAGKSTTLKAISRLIGAERGEITRGSICYRGCDLAQTPPWRLASQGLVQVLEGRRCFTHLSVEENLRLAAFVRRPSNAALKQDLERVYTLFPRLKTRRTALTGLTSGGEQQMVAIGRALMARPTLILLDEPSMGLAPQLVEEIFDAIAALNRDSGVSFLLAEQNSALALRFARYAYVLENGRVVASGNADVLGTLDQLHAAYLGTETG
ncbi:branched-chain amino acid ABC transporter ATP-binding protein [Robbsia andropogonis]|uniref:Branched-chain amino acid ABC transporter ATP-binding protein n=1 Tax=Robbsia andropogonis TaxID=28092 RepID=A0A0F5K138_9BURK|nr:ABC transporter ATP-binding protein [Robbsia andropogonis]KKB63272.1 branched-chain amino acid ABC transporter ATP-binding protein [Robbsia andropogonis]MCP1118233.1 ABC transporter ATP-binding protein [Robbsia andropogonis]MCP1127486.1 ABC transporter ATP-binding protein [Robbsia andropogonis]